MRPSPKKKQKEVDGYREREVGPWGIYRHCALEHAVKAGD